MYDDGFRDLKAIRAGRCLEPSSKFFQQEAAKFFLFIFRHSAHHQEPCSDLSGDKLPLQPVSETDDVINAHQWWSEASLLLLFDTFTVPAAQACRCRTVVLLWSISSESTQIVTLKTASCQN